LSIDFITEVVLDEIGGVPTDGCYKWAKNSVDDGECVSLGGYPCFVVLESVKERYNGSGDVREEVDIYRFVMMDGSDTLFKAAANTCLSGELAHRPITVGAIVVVYDYQLIWMRCERPGQYRFVMLINKMSWENEPPKSMGATIGKQISNRAISWVGTHGLVTFTVPFPYPCVGGFRNNTCTLEQFGCGDWINDLVTRCNWQTRFLGGCKPQLWIVDLMLGGGSVCQCISKHGFAYCVADTVPVEKLKLEDIYFANGWRWFGRRYGSQWGDLAHSDKHRSLRLWYDVNVCQIMGGEMSAGIPGCVWKMIEQAVPDRMVFNPKFMENYYLWKQKNSFGGVDHT
jgi:hypothetical protein